jgi:hypothetical protein
MRRKRRAAKTKRKWITLFLFMFALLIILIIVSQVRQPPASKKAPNECFEFSDVSALSESRIANAIRIKVLFFNMTAKCDVNHVVIFAQGMANPNDYYWIKIANGTTVQVEITFPSALLSVRQEEGFPVTLRIYSDEAEGKVTLYIPESNIIG